MLEELIGSLAWWFEGRQSCPVPTPPGFWPETFAQWVQVVATPVAVIAVTIAGLSIVLNGRWRHNDYRDERQRLASHVVCNVRIRDAGPNSKDHVVRGIELFNAGKEIIKQVRVQIIDLNSGQPVQVVLTGGRVVTEILLSHLAADGERKWDNVLTDPISSVEVDGERRVNLVPRVTWTDAAGWEWQMQGNGVPTRLS